MVYRGFWNILTRGQWYQIHQERCRISFPEEKPIYALLEKFRNGVDIQKVDKAIPVPFPLPLRHNLNYVYTLDLDSSNLTISFWFKEADEDSPGTRLFMRRLDLDSITEASDLDRVALLQNGSNPFGQFSIIDTSSQTEDEIRYWPRLDIWEIENGQPSVMNELQYSMFTDLTYQWKFFIDDRTIWPSESSTLFRRLCSAFLRLATWDFEITTQGDKAKLPLGAVDFPAWESPSTNIYWFHGFLVILCEDLGQRSMSASISQAREFVGEVKEAGKTVDCIFLSLEEIAFLGLSGSDTRCSKIFPFLTTSSAKECSPGFRVLTFLLTSRYSNRGRKARAAREKSNISLPAELLDLVLNEAEACDIVSFAQSSFLIEEWYYSPSSLPQLPDMKILHRKFSIPCCGKSDNRDGVTYSECYVWQHLKYLSLPSYPQSKPYTCPSCLSLSAPTASSSRPKSLEPGAISRLNRVHQRPKGPQVNLKQPGEEKILQLRVTSPAVQRPELRLMDRFLTNTPPNQIDYVILFGGMWTGLAYGFNDLDLVPWRAGYLP